MRLRLATRGSALALRQAEWVARRLRELGHQCELVVVTTRGDRFAGPIDHQSPRGLFTREVQAAVLEGRADTAVHSLKDLPTDRNEELTLAAVPVRASADDAFVSARFASIDALPPEAMVGTGSLRRRAQLLAFRPDLRLADLRGNVDTRLRKLDQGEYDAIILAAAGLERLDLAHRITQRLPPDIMLPAPGQGALGIEVRTGDSAVLGAVAMLDDPSARAETTAERTMLSAIQGGCLAPVAARGEVIGSVLRLMVRVVSLDGTRVLQTIVEGSIDEAEALGQRAAAELLAAGAGEIIARCRGA